MSSAPAAPSPSPDAPRQIRLSIPARYYLLPGTAVLVGTTLGLLRGSRAARLRFLAENAHRTPTTVRGWYFYNKTKNYRVMMAGLKMAGLDAGRLAASALGWVAVEEGMARVGLEGGKEVGAGLATAAVFSAVCEYLARVRAAPVLMLPFCRSIAFEGRVSDGRDGPRGGICHVGAAVLARVSERQGR